MAESITCPVCGLTSRHPSDVEEGYCHDCHGFTSRPPLMTTWTIYDRPRDFPDKVVVRGFDIFNGMTDPVPQKAGYLFADVETARAWVQQEHPEAVLVAPSQTDHPNVVETWV